MSSAYALLDEDSYVPPHLDDRNGEASSSSAAADPIQIIQHSAHLQDHNSKALTPIGYFRRNVQRFSESFQVRAVSFILVLVDTLLVIIAIAAKDEVNEDAINVISNMILAWFAVDVCLRVFVQQAAYFFNVLNILDIVLVIVATTLEVVGDDSREFTLARLSRLLFLIRLIHEQLSMQKAARRLVSTNKRRFQQDGFDLDVTYITDSILAMSFPSSGRMSTYRNPIESVARFLDHYHNGHFRVYNLCSERRYPTEYFHNQVECIGVDDHNCPTMRQLSDAIESIQSWLSADSANVAVIHCKGGKGRTGCLVSAYLVYAGICPTATAALEYFGSRRTDYALGTKFQGVETPSQSRYASFIEQMARSGAQSLFPKPVTKRLVTVRVFDIARLGNKDMSDLRFEVRDGDSRAVLFASSDDTPQTTTNAHLTWSLAANPVPISSDFKIKFWGADLPIKYDHCAFYFWYNTAFIEDNRLYLDRSQLDNPHKPARWHWYPSGFAVECLFEEEL